MLLEHTDPPLDIAVHLGHNPNIQTLKLVNKLHRMTAPYLVCLFSRLAAPKIRWLTFEFYPVSLVAGEWGEVDEVLGGHNYAALQGVTMSFPAWLGISIINDPSCSAASLVVLERDTASHDMVPLMH
jgi:hypothetical protein